MLINDAFSTARSLAIEEFQHERGRAQRNTLHARLLARPDHLDSFASRLPSLQPVRRYLGMQEIPVAQITGSVDRSGDFDSSFRPLKSHLRDRWVNIYLLAQSGGWPTIRVYKVGDQYFVEDGHHRVSVARALGMLSIQAEVWEYPPKPVQMEDHRSCSLACSPAPAECWCE
jgi:hypothetical protein